MTGAQGNVIELPYVRQQLDHQKRIKDKREELEEWQDLCAALHDGVLTWDRSPWADLTCPDRQQAAYELACEMRDQTRRELALLESGEPCPDCGTSPGLSCPPECGRLHERMGENK